MQRYWYSSTYNKRATYPYYYYLIVYKLIILISQIEDTKQEARRKMEEHVYKQPEPKKAEKFLLIKLVENLGKDDKVMLKENQGFHENQQDDETSALSMQTQLN